MGRFASKVAEKAVDFVVTSLGVATGNYLYEAVSLWVRNWDLVFEKKDREGKETEGHE